MDPPLLCIVLLQNKTEWFLNGFCFPSQNAVIVALSSKSWDVETATELLLSNWILTPSSSWSLSLLLTHTRPLSSRCLCLWRLYPLSHPVFHSGLLTSTLLPPLPSPCDISPPHPSPLLYHTPISRSLSSHLWFFFEFIQHSTRRYNQKLNHISPPFLKWMPDLKPRPHPPVSPSFPGCVQEAAVSSLSLPMQCIYFDLWKPFL